MKIDTMHPVVRKVICTCYNCPKTLTCLIFGNDHKPHHKILTGAAIILLGGFIGDAHVTGFVQHALAGSCSRFVEAMGSVPIIEHIGKIANGMTEHSTIGKPEEIKTGIPEEIYAEQPIDEPA